MARTETGWGLGVAEEVAKSDFGLHHIRAATRTDSRRRHKRDMDCLPRPERPMPGGNSVENGPAVALGHGEGLLGILHFIAKTISERRHSGKRSVSAITGKICELALKRHARTDRGDTR